MSKSVNAGSFGYTSIGASSSTIEDRWYGTTYLCLDDCEVDNVTVYLTTADTHKAKVCIYEDVGAGWCGSVIAQSDELTVNNGNGWYVFTFAGTVSLSASTNYYLVCWGEATAGSLNMRYDVSSVQAVYEVQTYVANFDDPETGDSSANTRNYSIYVNYNIPAVGCSELLTYHSSPSPLNNSENISITADFSVYINESDGCDGFNYTIECNNSQTISGNGVGNGTKTLNLNTLSYNTTYTIWVNSTNYDGSNKVSTFYQFTTRSATGTIEGAEIFIVIFVGMIFVGMINKRR